MALEILKGDGWKTAAAKGKLNDGGGLYLDVRSATSASWLFKFTAPDGTPDEMGLGSRKKIDLSGARALRLWAQGELNAKRNPRESRENEKLALRRDANAPDLLSVHDLAKAKVHLIARKVTTEKARKRWVRALHSDFIGYVADMDPAKVTEEDVKPLLTRLYTGKDMNGKTVCKATPVLADQIRRRLAAVLSFARADKRIMTPLWENPARWEDHLGRTLDTGDHVAKNHAGLPFFRVGKFIAAVRMGKVQTIALALEWHVISATRGCEACALDWSWFDWSNDSVTYPASIMKMKRPHRAPLTARHIEILKTLLAGAEPPEAGPVFVIRSGKSISTNAIRCAMHDVQTDITLHGFRSAFATWARSETYPITLPTGELRRVRLYDEALIEECLAHVVGDAARNAYVRDDFLELRRPVMAAWATYCGTVLEPAVMAPVRWKTAA